MPPRPHTHTQTHIHTEIILFKCWKMCHNLSKSLVIFRRSLSFRCAFLTLCESVCVVCLGRNGQNMVKAQGVWSARGWSGQPAFLGAWHAVWYQGFLLGVRWEKGQQVSRWSPAPAQHPWQPSAWQPLPPPHTHATHGIAPVLCTARVERECSPGLSHELARGSRCLWEGACLSVSLLVLLWFKILIYMILGCCETCPEPSFELCPLEMFVFLFSFQMAPSALLAASHRF